MKNPFRVLLNFFRRKQKTSEPYSYKCQYQHRDQYGNLHSQLCTADSLITANPYPSSVTVTVPHIQTPNGYKIYRAEDAPVGTQYNSSSDDIVDYILTAVTVTEVIESAFDDSSSSSSDFGSSGSSSDFSGSGFKGGISHRIISRVVRGLVRVRFRLRFHIQDAINQFVHLLYIAH